MRNDFELHIKMEHLQYEASLKKKKKLMMMKKKGKNVSLSEFDDLERE